jgi:PTH2 family peptidyl-tRNA hydrolase
MEPKQVIVIRTDLNMRKGKMCAQAAHASMKVLLDKIYNSELTYSGYRRDWILEIEKEETYLKEWIEGRFVKIVVGCNSEQELDELYNKAKEKHLLCSLIVDSGLTEFHGIPTKTCIAIGPAYPNDIDEITKNLKLL